MQLKVDHYVSVAPEDHVITRARVVVGGRTDDVSFFMRDTICGTVCVPAGRGALLCEQLHLVPRDTVSLERIQREFKQLLAAQE